jgi:hypothetical protein
MHLSMAESTFSQILARAMLVLGEVEVYSEGGGVLLHPVDPVRVLA